MKLLNDSRFNYDNKVTVTPILIQWTFPIGHHDCLLQFHNKGGKPLTVEDIDALSKVTLLFRKTLVRAEAIRRKMSDYEI